MKDEEKPYSNPTIESNDVKTETKPVEIIPKEEKADQVVKPVVLKKEEKKSKQKWTYLRLS